MLLLELHLYVSEVKNHTNPIPAIIKIPSSQFPLFASVSSPKQRASSSSTTMDQSDTAPQVGEPSWQAGLIPRQQLNQDTLIA
ncbi:hypothetical protein JTE90_014501 [Oedothorax gibbosus]|uniref:Uncharacterized protein n=1 Tax=Oedothorax gibbosus TaxID=931172 RepID=A0AAV6VKR9_9ARAC|nr:hypothetical protein JTE90_014501 [Oedothorax gibbosus]